MHDLKTAPKRRLIFWEIILVAPDAAHAQAVIEAVKGLNLTLEVENYLNVAARKCRARGSRLLAVYLSASNETRNAQISELRELTDKQPYPLLLIGECDQGLLADCNAKFSSVISLGEPAEIGEALVESVPASVKVEERPTRESQKEPHLRAVFQAPIEISFSGRESGRRYTGLKVEKVVEADNVLSSARAREEFAGWCSKHEPKVSAHMRRVLFSANEMCHAVDLFSAHNEALTTASGLFGLAIDRQDAQLLTADYLKEPQTMQSALADRINQSAQQLKQTSEFTGAARIVEHMAKLMENQTAPPAEIDAQSASLLLGVDLMDRVCFGAGFWNPRGAQRLLRAFAHGEVSCISEIALGSITRFLVNAFETGSARPDGRGQQERTVRLGDLQPGMRLSEALRARDGLKVLDAENILDAEMIWRIWSLAAVRPLCSPVSIRADIY